jgi:hypothetical protein
MGRKFVVYLGAWLPWASSACADCGIVGVLSTVLLAFFSDGLGVERAIEAHTTAISMCIQGTDLGIFT